jgi:hypothetical protein
MARFTRASQDVPKFDDYTHYRPYLRKDFAFQCAYCEMTEASVFGILTFGVDHFRPKKLFPDLTLVYQNLYYCCNDCNRYKGSVWPSTGQTAEGYFFPDPCACDPMLEHFRESAECRLESLTKAGSFALEILRLNRESCLRFRRKRQSLYRRITQYRILLDSIERIEVRDLLAQALDELEIECAECFGQSADR